MQKRSKILWVALMVLSLPLYACTKSMEGKLSESPSVQPWTTLSTPPLFMKAGTTGHVSIRGIDLHYVQKGTGPNLVLLHGGLGNLHQWANQIDTLSQNFTVTAFDSRGHGRSTRDNTPLSIHLMAEDIITAMTELNIANASVVGWSDGGNVGLDMALNHPTKINKLVTFGANYSPDGVKAGAAHDPLIGAYVTAMAKQYTELSITAEDFTTFSTEIFTMWGREPNFTANQLGKITIPVLVMHGEHEEAIKLEHSKSMVELLPQGELFVMEDVSHFGLWQNPNDFNLTVEKFLE